jgi:uncharacterized membrane protein YhfC
MAELLILGIAILAVGGAFYVYRKHDDSPVVLVIGALVLIIVVNALGL